MTGPRRERTDTAANRVKLIESARRQLDKNGAIVNLDAIAVDAGLGNATLYRHFPSRADLEQAAMGAVMDDVDRYLDALAEEKDAARAFERYVRFLTSTPGTLLAGELIRLEDTPVALHERRVALRGRVARLFERARAAHAIRDDVDLVDLNVFLHAWGRVSSDSRVTEPQRERLLRHYIDGLAHRS